MSNCQDLFTLKYSISGVGFVQLRYTGITRTHAYPGMGKRIVLLMQLEVLTKITFKSFQGTAFSVLSENGIQI